MKKKYKNIILLLLFFTFSLFSAAQKRPHAFVAGEHIEYTLKYNFGFVWLNIGYVDFRVDSITNNNIYNFSSNGRTNQSYDWFFKIRDQYKSQAKAPALRTLRFCRNTYHAGEVKKNTYLFNHPEKEIYSKIQNEKNQYQYDTLQLAQNISDVLTACYIMRDIDFSNYKINDEIPVKIILDGEIFVITTKFRGKETIENSYSKKYNCLKFTATPIKGTIFTGKDDISVWVTDDKNKIPIKISAKIIVGSVNAFLYKAKGLAY